MLARTGKIYRYLWIFTALVIDIFVLDIIHTLFRILTTDSKKAHLNLKALNLIGTKLIGFKPGKIYRYLCIFTALVIDIFVVDRATHHLLWVKSADKMCWVDPTCLYYK